MKSKHQISIHYIKTPVGELILGSYDAQLCLADWRYGKKRKQVDKRLQKALNAEYIEEDTQILQETQKQLNEYFNHQRKTFELPLLLIGTPFQKSVWQGLMDTPYGKTSSYLELAERIGNEKAVRAVATANGANAIAIIIPCHRIIGSNGTLVGYSGGLDIKKKLLELEGRGR